MTPTITSKQVLKKPCFYIGKTFVFSWGWVTVVMEKHPGTVLRMAFRRNWITFSFVASEPSLLCKLYIFVVIARLESQALSCEKKNRSVQLSWVDNRVVVEMITISDVIINRFTINQNIWTQFREQVLSYSPDTCSPNVLLAAMNWI